MSPRGHGRARADGPVPRQLEVCAVIDDQRQEHIGGQERPEVPDVSDTDIPFTDVVIIGAGLSGIGAAYRIAEKNPSLTYTLLERRSRIGGTWDLFRYPGIRSDSDIFTLSFPYEPWTREESVADGDHIRDYITATAHKYGIDRHIRFDTKVRSADWDSSTDTWTVHAEQGGTETTFRCRFLFFGTGYYNYDEGYTPEFEGLENFAGQVIHPQFWPEDLDVTGKKVVVIGSGATAITLIPALAEAADSVTMLQRTPTYIISMPKVEPLANAIRKVLPRKIAHNVVRWRNVLLNSFIYLVARKSPGVAKRFLRNIAVRNLPEGYDVDTHFKPSYQPWDQRMCLAPGADLYKAIAEGKASVVTDHIETFDSDGIRLRSGEHLDADIIVTATGLQLQALGGIAVSVDGEDVKPSDRFVYKGHMLEDVPNMSWCVGYTNASWTLRADMTAQSVAKLLSHMTSHGYTHAYPHLGDEVLTEKFAWDIKAGYVLRSPHALPKSGTRRPWNVRQNFLLDSLDHRFDRIGESMIFGRATTPATAPTVSESSVR